MVSWDLLYNVLRACFDGVKSQYCELPKKEEGEGEAKYLYARKVVGVKDFGEGIEVEYEVNGSDGKQKEVADLVLAADGPSSTIRKLLLPDVEREYAGYVAWRGTVPENEASGLMKETFVDNFTFFHAPGCQILAKERLQFTRFQANELGLVLQLSPRLTRISRPNERHLRPPTSLLHARRKNKTPSPVPDQWDSYLYTSARFLGARSQN
ncbi:hypothetical protein WAI453_005663 [Rhynchosporium graminicola]